MKYLKIENHYLKRAVEVAEKGKHSILLVSPYPWDVFGIDRQDIDLLHKTLCPCGNYLNGHQCNCSGSAIEKHRSKFPRADIVVTVEDIEFRQIKLSIKLDQECLSMFREVYSKLSLSPYSIESILSVSKTISEMDGSEDICLEHLTEAIQYQTVTV